MTRVLIIDDDRATTVSIKAVCLDMGHKEVECSYTFSDSLNKIQNSYLNKNPYDVVICDIKLNAENTGWDIREICEDKYPNLKFVMISGEENINFKNIFKEHIYFIKKPLKKHQLMDAFVSVLRNLK